MARFRYYVASSLDGFIADRNGGIEWLTQRELPSGVEETAEAGIADFVQSVGAVVMGSSTYEFLLGLGPDADWGYDVPAWVLSHRDLPVAAGHDVRFHAGAVADIVDDLEAVAADRDVWLVGGGDVVAQFAAVGRLHTIEVTVIPIVLGAGAPLLPSDVHIALSLVGSAPNPDGTVSLSYDVAPG